MTIDSESEDGKNDLLAPDRSSSLKNEESISDPVFSHSLLPPEVQQDLIREITEKMQAVESPSQQVYVVFSTQYYDDSSNMPFTVTTNRSKVDQLGPHVHTYGPFDAKMAAAVAYLAQEARILAGHPLFSKAIEKFETSLGLTSLVMYADGMGRLASHISLYLNDPKVSSLHEALTAIANNSIASFEEDIRKAKLYYEKVQQGLYGKSRSTLTEAQRELGEAEDSLRGFKQAIVLLKELLSYEWSIDMSPKVVAATHGSSIQNKIISMFKALKGG